MTLSPALAAQLDRFTDPRPSLLADLRALIAEADDLAFSISERLDAVEQEINGDKAPGAEDHIDTGADDASRLWDLTRDMAEVHDQLTGLEP